MSMNAPRHGHDHIPQRGGGESPTPPLDTTTPFHTTFFEGCKKFERDVAVTRMQLEKGRQVLPNPELALKYCEDIYSKVVSKVEGRMAKETKEQEQCDEEEALIRAKAEDALRGLVATIVERAVHRKLQGMEVDPSEDNQAIDGNLSRFVQSIEGQQKRDVSGGSLGAEPSKRQGPGKRPNHWPGPWIDWSGQSQDDWCSQAERLWQRQRQGLRQECEGRHQQGAVYSLQLPWRSPQAAH